MKFYLILKSWSPALFGLAVVLAVLSNALPYVHIAQDITVIGLGMILVALNVIKNIAMPKRLLTVGHNMKCRLKIGMQKVTFVIEGYNHWWHRYHQEAIVKKCDECGFPVILCDCTCVKTSLRIHQCDCSLHGK